MTLVNGLPINAFPGNPWSSATPQQTLELITTYNMEELDALVAPPVADLAWALRGSLTSVGTGIVKVPSRMPQRMNYAPFKYGGDRDYNAIDVVATQIKVAPYDLNFGFPMIWDDIGNGWKLMSSAPDGSLMEFVGIGGMAPQFVTAGQHLRAQLVASLFYESLYCTSLGLTSPKARCFPEPNNADGIALFTDGTGAEGSGGAQHYANPTIAGSGRFKNVFVAFGAFATNYGASLVKMTQIPHPTLNNVTSGARVTDTIGPTYMRDRFWQMAVSQLILQTSSVSGDGVAAATTNAFSDMVTQLARAGITEENFLGAAFGPRRFWIAPQLDNHPYVAAHPTDGPGGGPADFWINISAAPGRANWAKLACNSKEFVPTFRFYGPGDPRAMSERMSRFESDLDGGVSAGAYGEVQMFFGV